MWKTFATIDASSATRVRIPNASTYTPFEEEAPSQNTHSRSYPAARCLDGGAKGCDNRLMLRNGRLLRLSDLVQYFKGALYHIRPAAGDAGGWPCKSTYRLQYTGQKLISNCSLLTGYGAFIVNMVYWEKHGRELTIYYTKYNVADTATHYDPHTS